MAKNKEQGAGREEGGGSRLVNVLIVLLIIIIWLVVFGLLIKFDVGGLGSNVMRPVLKDIPLVNRILPASSELEEAEEGNYKYTTLKSANARIAELEKQLESEGGTTAANSNYISELEAEVQSLRTYKNEYDAFQQRVKDFETNVVYADEAPDLEAYRAYYEEISPENAEAIYRQVVGDLQYTERAKELATTYSGMEPDKAAERLEKMSEDLDLVCDILRNMKESQAALIVQEMSVEFAAQVTKKISMIK